MAISDQDYQEGLTAIKNVVREAGSNARVPTEICLVWLTADKPA